MKVSDFDFELPEGRIAQTAIEPRDAARLLLWQREQGLLGHRSVRDLPQLLSRGDLLILNDTRVLPARVFARRASGGAVELLFLESVPEFGGRAWRALARPAKKLRPDERLQVMPGLRVRLLRRDEEDGEAGAGGWIVVPEDADAPEIGTLELLERAGRLPLPPYIQREAAGDEREREDNRRYQTVFASQAGAIAAPTAGLHFTQELLEAIRLQGVEIATVTLHVGLGTFRPVTVEDTSEHRMHSESYVLTPESVCAIEACKARGGRVVAVGTTSVRVLESCADEQGRLQPGRGRTRMFIQPGYRFRIVDGLLTNFHLPRSTLLMLVSALTGREKLLELYRTAIEQGYRFYSYGDAMLIL